MTRRPQENLELIKRVLGDDYLELVLERITMEEDDESSKVVVETHDPSGNPIKVDGAGCGLVDALFSGLLGRYALEYESLRSVELVKFEVDAALDTKNVKSGVDAVGRVTIAVKNSEGRVFEFCDESRSIVSSAARAILAMVEYFVNAERAFITLSKARKDAIERRRDDLVTRYTQELAEVVKSTSYAEVIERIKKELG